MWRRGEDLYKCTVLGPLCKRGNSLPQYCKSCCCNRLWSNPKIPSRKEGLFFSGYSHEHFQAIFSWPVSGVYLSKPCRPVGDFCFGMVPAPLWQSNPPCCARIEDLAFAECFSQGKKKSTRSHSAAIHQHLEVAWAGACRLQNVVGRSLSAEVRLSQPAEVALGISEGRIWPVQIASNCSRLLSHTWNLRSGV